MTEIIDRPRGIGDHAAGDSEGENAPDQPKGLGGAALVLATFKGGKGPVYEHELPEDYTKRLRDKVPTKHTWAGSGQGIDKN